MSSIIYSTTGVVLSSSQHVAALESLNPDWTKLRVGLRLATADSLGNLSGVPRLAVGLCHGVDHPYLDDTCEHFVGGVTNNSIWLRKTAPLRYQVGFNGNINAFVPARKVGTTLSSHSTSVTGPVISAVETTPKSLLFVDIFRGNPTYTFEFFLCNSTVSGLWDDVTSTTFGNLIEAFPPSLAKHTRFTSISLDVDEGAGTLDAVNVAWDKPLSLTVHDLAVVDFS